MAAARKKPVPEAEIVLFASQEAWRTWLAKHGGTSTGLWLRLAKKGAGLASVSYPEALDVALCFGWIDGQKKSFDDESWLQRFTPRGPRSIWSKINVGHVERLTLAGRMQPAGLKAVSAAKADGRWDAAYESQSRATVPPDLASALEQNAEAKAFFEKLDATNRYAVLFRIHAAKKAETRARRIAQFVEMLARGEKIYP